MKETSDKTFEVDVLKNKKLVLVDFWATWCTPCKNLMPILKEALTTLGEKVESFSLNVEDNPNTPTTYNIMSLPTLILFYRGEVLDIRIGGNQDKDDLEDWLQEKISEIH